MADHFDPDAFMAARQGSGDFDPDKFMANRGAVTTQEPSVWERVKANLPSSLGNLYSMGQVNQPAQGEPEFLPYQPTRKQNQSMGGPPRPVRNPKAPVNMPDGLAIPPIASPLDLAQNVAETVEHPIDTFANDPAGTMALVGGAGRGIYEVGTNPTVVAGARAAYPDLRAGAGKAIAGGSIGAIAHYAGMPPAAAEMLGGGSAVPGIWQMGRGLKTGWQEMRGTTPRPPAPLPASVNLSRYAEPEPPVPPQPRAVSLPNEPIPATPQPRTVSFPDVGPPDEGRSGGVLPKPVRIPAMPQQPSPQVANGTTPLLDQIARGTGGRAFEKLSPSEQQAVRAIADRVQAKPEALPPQVSVPPEVPLQNLETPTPEALPPEVQVQPASPVEGSRDWHAQEAQRLYLERAKAKDLAIKDYLGAQGKTVDEWMALTPAERAAQLKELGFKLGRDRRPEFARGGVIGLPPKVNLQCRA